MGKPKPLHCPKASRGEHMRIFCTDTGDYCPNQKYCGCCGWYILTEKSYSCERMKEESHGPED